MITLIKKGLAGFHLHQIHLNVPKTNWVKGQATLVEMITLIKKGIGRFSPAPNSVECA